MDLKTAKIYPNSSLNTKERLNEQDFEYNKKAYHHLDMYQNHNYFLGMVKAGLIDAVGTKKKINFSCRSSQHWLYTVVSTLFRQGYIENSLEKMKNLNRRSGSNIKMVGSAVSHCLGMQEKKFPNCCVDFDLPLDDSKLSCLESSTDWVVLASAYVSNDAIDELIKTSIEKLIMVNCELKSVYFLVPFLYGENTVYLKMKMEEAATTYDLEIRYSSPHVISVYKGSPDQASEHRLSFSNSCLEEKNMEDSQVKINQSILTLLSQNPFF